MVVVISFSLVYSTAWMTGILRELLVKQEILTELNIKKGKKKIVCSYFLNELLLLSTLEYILAVILSPQFFTLCTSVAIRRLEVIWLAMHCNIFRNNNNFCSCASQFHLSFVSRKYLLVLYQILTIDGGFRTSYNGMTKSQDRIESVRFVTRKDCAESINLVEGICLSESASTTKIFYTHHCT